SRRRWRRSSTPSTRNGSSSAEAFPPRGRRSLSRWKTFYTKWNGVPPGIACPWSRPPWEDGPEPSVPLPTHFMEKSLEYLERCAALLETVRSQHEAIAQAADWFADTILAGRMVHLFGSGHSRIMVEEMWPRYGSFPGFNPIVEQSLSFHNLVV